MAKTEEVKTPSKKNGTMVASCTCAHKFQDSEYGAGRRLHNISAKGAKRRCTVCGRETGL
jgi:hypothetical protein